MTTRKLFRWHLDVCLAFLLNLTACEKTGLFKESGPITIHTRAIKPVGSIELFDKVNLVLTQDSVESIKVETGENLQKDIETSFIDQRLIIRDNNNYKWLRDLSMVPTVYIHAKAFRSITYLGAGAVSSTNVLVADSFSIDSRTGTGSIKLRLSAARTDITIRTGNVDLMLEGNTDYNQVYCADQGKLDLRKFITGELVIDYRSIQDSYVQATTLLNARVLYKGNLYYIGQPGIQLVLDNTGRLIKF